MSREAYTTLRITKPHEHVVRVEMNRPEKRNAMNVDFFSEMRNCFEELDKNDDCRVVVLTGAGKVFSAGLDIKDAVKPGHVLAVGKDSSIDVGRKAFKLMEKLRASQETFTVIEKCSKPVIAAIHGACVGGGVDMTSACDIRYCSQDAWFQVKETDIGAAAAYGTLQRFPRIIGNESTARELAFTTRRFYADEAKDIGFVSQIFQDAEACREAALATAQLLASKSPVGAQGTKLSMVYSRDHSVADGLDHIALLNLVMNMSGMDMSQYSRLKKKTAKP